MRKTKKQILKGINVEDIEKSRLVENNTLEIHYKNGEIAIRLHNTNIITFKRNGNVVLNSGGYHTNTTRQRINAYLPFNKNLYQHNHIWYIGNYKPKDDIVFYDNIVFDKLGNLKSKDKKVNTKKINKIRKSIKKYVDLLDKMEKLPLPSNGDCWDCLFKDSKTGETMGDKRVSDHLQQHIIEGYVFGTILVNSMLEDKYRPEQIYYYYNLNCKDIFKRALTKYLQKRLLK